MNINQLNQNEYVDKSKEWTENIEDVANKAEDMFPNLKKEPGRSKFIKYFRDGVNSDLMTNSSQVDHNNLPQSNEFDKIKAEREKDVTSALWGKVDWPKGEIISEN